MTEPLLRITYLSKNSIAHDATHALSIDQILATSQANNSATGITGALMFNCGFFGQVLEGPQSQVEATFERIQLDDRHFDVRVLNCGPVASRVFGRWSMGFVGLDLESAEFFGRPDEHLFADPDSVDEETLFGALHKAALKNEFRLSAA